MSETRIQPSQPNCDVQIDRIVEKKLNRRAVVSVAADSPAEAVGIRPGDLLVEINGFPILDIVDYQFHCAGENLAISIVRGSETLVFHLEKGYGEDLGIEFGDDLFDRIHTCKNNCIFCFLRQQPKGLRPSLYIKDDDYRLSFLHGNYLTLTNIGDAEFERIIAQKLSPLFVSVHATDPDTRGRLLGRKGAEPVLPRIEKLIDARIQIHAQIVLCPGHNDGDILRRSLDELEALHPSRRGTYGGVTTVAIVPVGLTQFRDRLPGLTVCDARYCRTLLGELAERRFRCHEELGSCFVFPSDEFYLNAGLPIPSAKHYEGFELLEDGIGLVRQFMDDHAKLAKKIPKMKPPKRPRSVTLITGELASPLIRELADTLNKIKGLSVNVATVHNFFFEGNITVTGLLTGQDIASHLIGMGDDLGDLVLAPSVMVRASEEQEFIDGMTIAQLSEKIGRSIKVVDCFPHSAAEAAIS